MEHRTHRQWFLTWRTYGTWLPGDDRGFVGPAIDPIGVRGLGNAPGEPTHSPTPPLRDHARGVMRGEPLRLDATHAADVFEQLRNTADYRDWSLLAVAVTPTHVHLFVRVEGDPDGADILRDFKSYAARRLNQKWGRPANGSWWSESGSRRVLKGEGNVVAAVQYVAQQAGAWLVWYVPVEQASEHPANGERPA